VADQEWQVLLQNENHAEEAANTGQSLGNFIPPEVLELKRKSNMGNRVTFKKESKQDKGEEGEASPNTHAGEIGENRDRIDSFENEDSFEE